jgi:FkbM family methyltransferase
MNLTILRFKKLFAALTTKENRRALRFGVAPSIEHNCSFAGLEYKTIVDIGANKGQFALFARQQFPKAQIISFEPLKAASNIYATIFADDRRARLFKVAVGPHDGDAELFVTRDNDASSFFKPSSDGEALFGITVAGIERVPMVPLHQKIAAADIQRPALLKLDVQGFELDALQGCAELLSSFDQIYVEVSFVEVYAGQPLASAIIAWLSDRKFMLRGVFNQVVDQARRPIQADMLFARTG